MKNRQNAKSAKRGLLKVLLLVLRVFAVHPLSFFPEKSTLGASRAAFSI
jgi:hypothetical protein